MTNLYQCTIFALRLFCILVCLTPVGVQAQTATLPIYESFDSATLPLVYGDASGIHGLPGWDYSNDMPGCQLQFRQDALKHPGSKFVATLDNPQADCVNHLTVTFNAASLNVATDTLLLSFDWFSHGDESDVEDMVEVRGNPSAPWIKVIGLHESTPNFVWNQARDINLSALLANASQAFSAQTQVRFSQSDNFPIPTDGISLDDVSIELAASADSESASPEILLAKMVNYQNPNIVSGQQIEYKVTILNPTDLGAVDAENAVFELTDFADVTELVVGSVMTSQGVVVTGNTAGDTSVRVELGDVSDGASATVYFKAEATFDGEFEFGNQGSVSADNVSAFLTEDPTRDSGSADPTLARFVLPIQLPVFESFDAAVVSSGYRPPAEGGELLLPGLNGWTYVGESGTPGRIALRTDFRRRFIANTLGSGLILSMDNPSGGGINRSVLTFDGSGINVTEDQVLLSFDWFDHGDEGDFEDVVQIRGSSRDKWVTLYSFASNSNNGSWSSVRNIDISSALALANPPQGMSDAVQIRFSQTDNFSINTDGISLEDVTVEIAPKNSETDSPVPEVLIASMLDYVRQDVNEGDSLEYKVSIINPKDELAVVAQSVVFELPSLPEEYEVLAGSVFTSQGTVTIGNSPEDQTIRVELGDLSDGNSAAIYFRATPKFLGTLSFYNQGVVSADNVVQFHTQDPTRTLGPSETTLARFARIQRSIADLAIDHTYPVKGDTAMVSATGTDSIEPIVYSSDTPSICTLVSAQTIQFLARGTCTVRANQAGDAVYLDAIMSTLTFLVDNDTIDDAIDNCPLQANEDQADFEGDGIGDVCDDDDDGDGMSDAFEIANGLNPRNSFDRDADPDGDGFTNGQEAAFNTDPNVANEDLNSNGIPDITEQLQQRTIQSLPAVYQLLLD